MHYSRPRAVRVLTFLRRNGGSATTLQIQEGVRTVCASTDVSQLRAWLRDKFRMEDTVGREFIGVTPHGEHVHRYTLAPELMQGLGRQIGEREGPDGNGDAKSAGQG